MADSKNLSRITSILIQATLFSDYGIMMSGLAETMQTSKPPYRHLKALEGMGPVKKRIGKEVFHTVSLQWLLDLSNAQH